MAVRTITTRLVVDGETAFKKAMGGANASLRELRSELTLAETQFKGQANTLEALTKKQDILSQTYEQQAEKVRALKQAVADATKEWGAADTTTLRYHKNLNQAQAELLRMGEALEEVNGYLREAQGTVDHTAFSIDEFGNSTESAGSAVNTLASALAAAGVARAIDEIAGAIIDCTKASTQFQSDITGVFKTVDGTDRQLAEIRDGIKQMSLDIPATTTAISKVAESAGQLGIARENILDFTRVMIDLDETTDMSAENGAKSLARFANVTKMQAEDYSRLGSVIVDLGNNFATSESEITEMGTRLAAAGTLAKMTQPEILALGAAMSSVGLEAEAGGTAMTQTLTAMEKAVTEGGAKLDEFARIAGMSSQEFAAAWNESSVSALQAFISGLAQLDEQGESATLVLDELGLSGIRQSNMLKSLALASDQMTGAIELANRAWAENTALTEEAAKRYADDAAKFERFGNAANNAAVAVGDALRPALGELAEAGTEGFAWAAEFIEENPWLVQAIVGVTTALGIYTGTITAYSAVAAAAKKAQDALNLSLLTNPIILATAAISGLIVALGAYSASLDKVGGSSKELIRDLQDTAQAYEDTREAMLQESSDVSASIAALEELAAVENKSAVQKAILQQLVEELNASIPDLTLSYDAEADSLRDMDTGTELAAASIRELAQAEFERQERDADVRRLSELLREQVQIEAELADARGQLAAAQETLNAELEAGNPATVQYETAVYGLQKSVLDLEAALNDNAEAQEELSSRYNETAETAAEAVVTYQAFTGEVDALTASVSVLADALKEQEAQGRLSEATARALEEAGYGTALAIDTETEAVTLNRDAYVELVQAKIEDQIQSLEVRRQSALDQIALASEGQAALHTGSAYWEMAKAKAAAAQRDIAGYDSQIASLREALAALEQYRDASVDTGEKVSIRAGQSETAAQRDLAAYKELRAELDHQKTVELVTERDYYVKLKEYRDQYLTDEGNVDEYRRVTEQIYKYDKALADSEAALWAEQTETLTDELEERVRGIESQRQGMERALSGYGELFTVKDDRMSLESIQEQIDAINRYEEAMTRLRERGLSQDLLDEVLAMNVDEATAYGEQLLAMSDSQWEQYNALWDEKQLRAAQVAEQFYKDQLQELETEYNARLDEALDGLTDTAFQSGADTARGLIEGLASQEEALYAKARAMEQEVARIWKDAWKDIPSNAEIAASLNPEAMRTEPPATETGVRRSISAGVNGLLTAFTGIGAAPATAEGAVYLDGQQVGRIMLPGLRAEARANPEVVDDT